MRARPTRRAVLRGAARAAGGLALFHVVPRHVLGGPGFTPPSEVLTRAVIGTGGMGISSHVTENEEGKPPVTLAVCDVDRNHLAAAMKKAGRACEAYGDWRKVLDRRDVDVVHVATPPHWHALIAAAAAQCGFDVLCEKPLTRTIREGQVLVDAVKRYGRVLQVNTHFRFQNYYEYGSSRLLRKLVMSGLLGSPLTVRVGPRQGFNWKVREWSGRTDLTPRPVPAELDYEMWLGPAPRKPYHPHRVHQSFRGYWDYDGGGLADMGQHYLDPVQYFLGKDDTGPVEVSAVAPWPAHPEAVGLWESVAFLYENGDRILLESGEWRAPGRRGSSDARPAEGGWPTSLTADEGGEAARSSEDAFISGPRGRVFANYRTEPPGLFERLGKHPDPEPLLDFETCVRTRQSPGGNVEVAHRSCSLVNLANIAIRTGRTIRWDPQRQRCLDDEQANRLVHQPMRAPWSL